MYKTLTTVITLALSLLTASLGVSAEDSRQKVEFPEMMKQHMMANMRDHLAALSEIQQFMALAEYEQAAEVAEQRLGMSSLDNHGAAHMAQMMPKEMQEIGTGMHKAASQFAITVVDAEADDNLKPALAALAKVTQQCIACHSAYRVY